jgi:hypothetical protein
VRLALGRSAIAAGVGALIGPYNQSNCETSYFIFCSDPTWQATYTAGWFVAQLSFEHRSQSGFELRVFVQSSTIVAAPRANACEAVPCTRTESILGTTAFGIGLDLGFTIYP